MTSGNTDRIDPGFSELMSLRGRGDPAYPLSVMGCDPVYPGPFRIGETTAAIMAAIGVAVSDIHRIKTGEDQAIGVSVPQAAATLRSADHTYIKSGDGSWQRPLENERMTQARSITQPWQTRDGRWFLPHFKLDHLRKRVLDVLRCPDSPEGVAAAIRSWDAEELEAAIHAANACGGIVRSAREWAEHPHGQHLATLPVVEIEKIGESAPRPFGAGSRPLENLKVLDLTRILAGPIAARTLAEHGADVLMVTAAHLPQADEHVRDTSHGKRSTFLDLNDKEQARILLDLASQCDVFSQGYRPGVMENFGLDAQTLARANPGIVYLSISCYGAGGPFSGAAGWEQVAQAVTGICHDQGTERPQLISPAICDYSTGYLGAYGVLLALLRRAHEGGSYHVRVSLCQSGMFLYRQGKVHPGGADCRPAAAEVAAVHRVSKTGYGEILHLGPVLSLSRTPPFWAHPSPILGEHPPAFTSI